VADRSLTYFLFFISFWLVYNLYRQHTENERIFNIATDQQERITQQLKLIKVQKVYIELLEEEVIINYRNKELNPLHTEPL
jgi:hypothetical protein